MAVRYKNMARHPRREIISPPHAQEQIARPVAIDACGTLVVLGDDAEPGSRTRRAP